VTKLRVWAIFFLRLILTLTGVGRNPASVLSRRSLIGTHRFMSDLCHIYFHCISSMSVLCDVSFCISYYRRNNE
jgi:hypothetical protein